MCQKTTQSSQPIARINRKVFKKELGFSLIELLFTLALAGILLSLAVPTYQRWVVEIRLASLTERITSAINYARSEAIKRRDVVIICKSKDGKTCTGEWRNGWIIYFGKHTTHPLENNLLRIYPNLHKNEFLEWRGSGGRDYLQLNPDGTAYGHNGSFITCIKFLAKSTAWLIKLSQTGRLRVDKEIENQIDCNSKLGINTDNHSR
jgi:type IV fimbrial biogenesis protein FimT